jgi:diguanylate cyclase (GGDEF)-like protein/PAS domain S-box-containing protein
VPPRDLHRHAGLVAALALPLTACGATPGIVGAEADAMRFYVALGVAAVALTLVALFCAFLLLRHHAATGAAALRRAEQALRAADLRFQLMTEQMHDVIWQMTPDLVFTFISPADQRLRGYRSGQVIGKSFLVMLTPASAATLHAAMASRGTPAEGEAGIALELEQRCDDGSTVWTEVIFNPQRRDGDVIGYQGVTRDISDRRRMQEALQRSELVYRTLLEAAPFPAVVTRLPEGTVQVINRRAAQRMAVHAGSTVGRSAPDFWVDPARRERFMSALGESVHVSGFEAQLKTASGEKFWANLEAATVDIQGAPHAFVAFNDISHRRAMEQALRDANAKLEGRLEEIHALQVKLELEAIHDALTGLYNRRYLDETLERELDRARREGYPLTLAMLDLDHFKRINDTRGHPTGDLVLQRVGALLLQSARSGDIPCRYGGEEFLLVLPYMGLEAARDRAEEWRRMTEALRVPCGDTQVGTTTSIGLATFPLHGDDARELIAAADAALYAAKAAGRNCVLCCRTAQTGAASHPFVMSPASSGGAPC